MLYIGITTLRSFELSTCILFIPPMQSVNAAQFLNVTSLFLSSDFVAPASASTPVAVVAPLKLYKHHFSHRELTLEL